MAARSRRKTRKEAQTMTRQSGNDTHGGHVRNGFDYDLQVWTRDYIVQECGHGSKCFIPAERGICCNGKRYAGQDIRTIGGQTI